MKVLIADSNNLIRVGLRTVIAQHISNAQIVEAATGSILKKILQSDPPDVVLIDYTAREFTIDVLPEAKAIAPQVPFVAITYDQMGKTIIDALRMGVTSYIKKDCDIGEIVDAVKDLSLIHI